MEAKKENTLILNILTIKVVFSVICQVGASNNAINDNLFKEVLDASACEKQINHLITSDTILKTQFMDASLRIPRGISKGNLRDMGSYYECLGINKKHLEITIEGKYCVIQIPLNQKIDMLGIRSGFPWVEQHWQEFNETKSNIMDSDTFQMIQSKEGGKAIMKTILGNKTKYLRNNPLQYELAICIPKACTTQQALSVLTKNLSSYFEFREAFCRLPNDKPFVVVDYIAISIFSALGLLTLICTTYDVRHLVILKRDPKQANKLYTIFSAYSNAKKFFTFNYYPNTLNCLDGIRAISMLWVIVSHIFYTQYFYLPVNPVDFYEFLISFSSTWITAMHFTVDTFLMIGGLLLVYTSALKISKRAFLKNLHIFYLNRLLRLFPVLATAVLLQASLLNHVSDGPFWNLITNRVNDCRENWWRALLFVNNFIRSEDMCLENTWYLSVDMQLYIISPLVLIFIYGGNKRTAWTALIGFFLLLIISSTIYIFTMEFRSFVMYSWRPETDHYYNQYYYINTFTRAAPYHVGMIFEYILRLCRGKQFKIPKVQVILLWLLALGTMTAALMSNYFPLQSDWDNQTIDSFLNSFMRPAWAVGVAWVVFACTHGYAGPINWFLSLHILKMLSRLSYAMYIFHLPIIYITNATMLTPTYFTVEFSIQKFMIDLNFTIIVAFLVTILIEFPFSSLIGIYLDSKKYTKERNVPKNADVKITESTYI